MRLAMEGYWMAHQTKAVRAAADEYIAQGCLSTDTYINLQNLGVDPEEVMELIEEEQDYG